MSRQLLNIDTSWYSDSWGIARVIRRKAPWKKNFIRAPISTFFECERDGTGVDIYLIDTSINTTHPEFSGRATNAYAPLGALADGHATMTAGIAAGSTIGVARGAEIFSFQWANGPTGTVTAFQNALDQALIHYNNRAGLNRPAVCALEFDGTGPTSPTGPVRLKVDALIDAGMVCLGAAGNDGAELIETNYYPMTYPDVICVGAIGPNDMPSYFPRVVPGTFGVGTTVATRYGERVDIMAPGQYQKMANWDSNSGYTVSNGSTSGALALATGISACMLQGHSRLTTRAQVASFKQHLLSVATTGELQKPDNSPLGFFPDRIIYLDPKQTAPEPIAGL